MTDRIALEPENEAAWKAMRVLDVTSTESSALFGQSPYQTEFELWHQKREQTVVEIAPNERMDWGNDLQDSIATSLARRYGVNVVRVTEYMRIQSARMGASFDFEIIQHSNRTDGGIVNDALRIMFAEHGPGILEIKNVDRTIFRDRWTAGDDGALEAPGHIEIQLQHQMHVRDRAWGAIGVLVGGNTGRLLIRKRDREVGDALEARIRKFWETVDKNTPPPPFYPDDAKFVAMLYGHAEPGRIFDGRGREDIDKLLGEYTEAGTREKLAKEDKEVAKAKVLAIIGDCERAYTDGYSLSAGMVAEANMSYVRPAYRNFRTYPKKKA